MNPEENVGRLTLELHRKAQEFADAARVRAEADVEYRSERAKRMLRARSEEERCSMALAETVADADDAIKTLRFNHLVAEANCDALKHGMTALRERIGFGRSLMTNQREADKLLATDRSIT